MKEFYLLRILDKLSGIFKLMKVDYSAVRAILQVKFTLDRRRPSIALGQKNIEAEGNQFIKSLGIYLLIGFLLIPVIFLDISYIYQMSFVFSFMMFLIMTVLISDFSTVLLDIKDKSILAIRPISERTLSTAKAIHIFVYMLMITLAICGPALITSLFLKSISFFLLFLLEIILADLFILMITALIYTFILRFFDGERLKDIINYVQIFFMMFISIGSQLIGRAFDFINFKIDFTLSWWNLLIPPLWFGAPFELIIQGNNSMPMVILSLLALIIPIIAFILYILISPSLEKNLQKLNYSDSQEIKSKPKVYKKVGKLLCRSKEERAFFNFVSEMRRGDRGFKLRVYPSIGVSIILPFIILFTFRDFQEVGRNLSVYLSINFVALMIPMTILNLVYSDSYKGGRIYEALPIKNNYTIYSGALKSVLSLLLLPIYLFVAVVFLYVEGLSIIPGLFVSLCLMPIIALISFKIFQKRLPFSMEFLPAQQGESIMSLVIFLVIGILTGIQKIAESLPLGQYILSLIYIFITILLWKRILTSKE